MCTDHPASPHAAVIAVNVHSRGSLSAVSRWQVGGGGYDSEQCYTYVGSDCWVVRELQSSARPCRASDSESSPIDDNGPEGPCHHT